MLIKLLTICITVMSGMIAIRKYHEYLWGKCKSKKSMKNKTVIITGANCGLGKATAIELAKRGARVILACRDLEKAQKALVDIRSQSRNGILKLLELDLASFESIKKFAEEFLLSEERLDVLINNAGLFQCPFMKTKQGFEMQFGVNHLGHFLLTKLLLEKLKHSAPSRIVIVTSSLYKKGEINFDNLNGEQSYNKSTAYMNSKLANIHFSQELARRLKGTGVSVYAVSPGIVWTNLGRHIYITWWKMILLAPLACLYMRTAHQGCQTIVNCAVSEEIENESGFYYANCRKEPITEVANNETVSKKLWEVSEQFCQQISPEN